MRRLSLRRHEEISESILPQDAGKNDVGTFRGFTVWND
jgi:hypothetical protein